MTEGKITVKYETETYRVITSDGKKVFVKVEDGKEELDTRIDAPLRANDLPQETEITLRIPVEVRTEEPVEEIDRYPRKLGAVVITDLNPTTEDRTVFDPKGLKPPVNPVPVFVGSFQAGEATDFYVDADTGEVVADIRLRGNMTPGEYYPSLAGIAQQKTKENGMTRVESFVITGVALNTTSRGSRVSPITIK